LDAVTKELNLLDQKIDRLKREYDLFLAGTRRVEPTALRDEVAREVLRITRSPLSSTAARFRVRTLAHRFQAIEVQLKNLVERRASRPAARADGDRGDPPTVMLDRAALENPASVEIHLRRMHRAVADATGNPSPPPPLKSLKERILQEARRHLDHPGVLGVRFSVVTSDEGKTKIRGEVVQSPASPA
jgi:hypothetical protein